MRTSTLLFPLLAVPLFALAACTQDVTVAPAETSFTSYDSVVRQAGFDGLEVVVLVDDSASAASARPIFASRIRSALARFVGPELAGEEHADAVQVVVRGASSGAERRVAFLADAPANAWKTPNGELREPTAFLDAVDAAIGALPVAEGALRFLDAIVAAEPHAAGSVAPRTIFLVATAHDDASTHAVADAVTALGAFERPSLSLLVDARSVGPLAATDVQPGPVAARAACGVAVPGDEAWPKGDALPRLVAAAVGARKARVQWAELCANDSDAGDLLLQHAETLVTPGCAPLPAGAKCTAFVAPPVSGTDALCARPELGLAPASSEARAHYARSDYASTIAGRPLCALHELGPTEVGAGFRIGTAECPSAATFTPSARPVAGSWLFLHCESTR